MRYKIFTGPCQIQQTADNFRNSGINIFCIGTEHIYVIAESIIEVIDKLREKFNWNLGFSAKDFETLASKCPYRFRCTEDFCPMCDPINCKGDTVTAIKSIPEYVILTQNPENCSVGELNQIVRILRERLYQMKLKLQAKEGILHEKELFNLNIGDTFQSIERPDIFTIQRFEMDSQNTIQNILVRKIAYRYDDKLIMVSSAFNENYNPNAMVFPLKPSFESLE